MERVPSPRSTRITFGVVAAALLARGIVGAYLLSQPPSPSPVASAPIGPGGLAWGAPENSSGSTSVGCPAAPGHYCYPIEIAGGAALALSGAELSLRNASGGSVAWPAPPGNDTISLTCANGTGTCALYDSANAMWTVYGSNPTSFLGGETLVVFTPGTGPSFGLQGDALVLTDAADGITNGDVANPFP